MKNKQFTARSSHSRSASIGRNLNRLSEFPSINGNSNSQLTGQNQVNQGLNRSKSSDGIVRTTRSHTKLTALQPMKRSRSHQLVHVVPHHTTPSKPEESDTKATFLISSKEDKIEDETENEDKVEEEVEVEVTEEVENFSDDDIIEEPVAQQILSYKAPSQFSHKFIEPGSSLASEQNLQTRPPSDETKVQNTSSPLAASAPLVDPMKLSETTSKLSLQITNEDEDEPQVQHETQENDKSKIDELKVNTTQLPVQDLTLKSENTNQRPNSKEELKDQYFQNMILSQSTGVVRAFGDKPFDNSLLDIQGKHQEALYYVHSNDHISTPNVKINPSSLNSLRQFTINQQILGNKLSVSNESSSILSFKAINTPKNTSTKSSNSIRRELNISPSETPNNFSQFLRSNNPSIETRTQQKLWLQRENSLIDFALLNNSNQTNPHVRREFEKVSKEYQFLKRFNNPILDSFKRVSSINKSGKKNTTSSSTSPSTGDTITENKLNSFKTPEIQQTLTSLWATDSMNKNQNGYSTSNNVRQQQYRQQLQHTHYQQLQNLSQQQKTQTQQHQQQQEQLLVQQQQQRQQHQYQLQQEQRKLQLQQHQLQLQEQNRNHPYHNQQEQQQQSQSQKDNQPQLHQNGFSQQNSSVYQRQGIADNMTDSNTLYKAESINFNDLRAPVAPTTRAVDRAVDRAANSPENNKRIDLNTIRL